MTDEKKEPITMDLAAENDPAADEIVVMDLQKQIRGMEENIQFLQYQNEGMSDMARMNAAIRFLANQIERVPGYTKVEDVDIEFAIDLADRLISRYQELIEGKAREYHQRVMEQQKERGNGDSDAVN